MPGMDPASLFSQGVAVAVLIWFMLRLENILKEVAKQVHVNTKATLLLVTNAPAASAAVKHEVETLAKGGNGGKA